MDFICYIYMFIVFYPSVVSTVSRSERVIRCFNCDLQNNNCDDRFNTIGVEVKNCSGSCVKIKMYNKDEGEPSVTATSHQQPPPTTTSLNFPDNTFYIFNSHHRSPPNGHCSPQKDTKNVYGRYCTPGREEERCQVTDSGDLHMEECYCNKDLCNAGTSMFQDSPTLIVAVTFAIVINVFSVEHKH